MGRFEVWIGQERKTHPPLLFRLGQLFRRINTDRDDLESQTVQCRCIFLQLNQLPAAMWSPVSPVEDENR